MSDVSREDAEVATELEIEVALELEIERRLRSATTIDRDEMVAEFAARFSTHPKERIRSFVEQRLFAAQMRDANEPPPARWPVVPGYEIIRWLGGGGYGDVYLANQPSVGRQVALKVLTGAARAIDVDRFLNEAKSVAACKHPNVVIVHESRGSDGGDVLPCLVMEYCPGGTLDNYLPAGRMLLPQAAAALVKKIADAVSTAHAAGLVHRDLKPANILFDKDGEPKVVDFGLAKRPKSDLTHTGVTLGTPAYMSPEQFTGAKFVGPQADVWALGVILYRCLTGRQLFTGKLPALAVEIGKDELHPPRNLNRHVPKDLNTICTKCLENDPVRRYPDAGQLRDDLERFLNGESVHARPVGWTGRAWRWCRRNRIIVTLVATVGVAIWLAAVAAHYRSLHSQIKSRQAALEVAHAQVQTEKAEAQATATKLQVANTKLDGANKTLDGANKTLEEKNQRIARDEYLYALVSAGSHLREGEYVQARITLDGCDRTRRCFVWHYLDAQCPLQAKWGGASRIIQGLVFSADGAVVAVGGAETIEVWEVAAGRVIQTFPGPEFARPCALLTSPGGRVLACKDDRGNLTLWDVPTRKRIDQFSLRMGAVVVSPDGETLAGGSFWGASLTLWSATKREFTSLPIQIPANWMAFSPDGKRLAVSSTDGRTELWDVVRRERLRHLPTAGGHVTFNPDGKTLAIVPWHPPSRGGELTLWDTATGATSRPLRTTTVKCVAFHPRDKSIAVVEDSGRVAVWNLTNGCEVREYSHDVPLERLERLFAIHLGFRSDGSRLALVGTHGDAVLWDVPSGKVVRTARGGNRVVALAVTPDGKAVAVGDPTLADWHLPKPEPDDPTPSGNRHRIQVLPPSW